MALELESLRKTIGALQRSLQAAHSSIASLDAALQETVRAGVIQHFEMAYEQCWKFMQRWMRVNVSPEDADYPRTRKELFRMAARQGLISDPIPWFSFSDARNLSAHTYDEAQAVSVYDTARLFLPHALELLARLEERND